MGQLSSCFYLYSFSSFESPHRHDSGTTALPEHTSAEAATGSDGEGGGSGKIVAGKLILIEVRESSCSHV